MQFKKNFSIIELMTVILIVLLLISLTVPVFVSLKMNARTAICKGQLRQIGVLMTSYASAYGGYLPNDDALNYRRGPNYPQMWSDLTRVSNPNHDLYSNWNGHLLPFIDTGLKNYERAAMVDSSGKVRWTIPVRTGNYVGYPTTDETNEPSDPLTVGWAVINDAYLKGGYNDLKVFICPEIHGNTYDVRAHDKFGIFVPRIRLAQSGGAFEGNSIWTLKGGTPTTYIANDYFFGRNGPDGSKVDSLRVDEISDISHKVFLIEGGMSDSDLYGSCSDIYFGGGNKTTNYDLGLSVYENHFGKNENYFGHKLSFVHDNKTVFWKSTLNQYYDVGQNISENVVAEFNVAFDGKAYMLPSFNPSGATTYHIVSFIEPSNGDTFKDFYIAKKIGSPPTDFRLFDEQEYQYLAGSTNALFGDGSVSTKDQGWLYNNRERIAKSSKE